MKACDLDSVSQITYYLRDMKEQGAAEVFAAGAPPPLPSEVSKRAPGRPKGSGNKQQKPASWHGAQSWGHYKAQVKFVTKAVDAKKQKDSGADVGMTLQQAKDHLQSEGINLSRSAIHMLAKKPGQSPNKVGRPATLPSEAGQKLADFVLALRAQRIPVTKDIVLACGNAMIAGMPLCVARPLQ